MDFENLPRWIVASINKHFNSYKGSYPLYFEGAEKMDDPAVGFELRIDGPSIQNPSKGHFIVTVEINMVVTTMRDEQDHYKHQRAVGVACTGFTESINIFKFGDGLKDDGNLLACLTLQSQGREKIVVSNFGLIYPTLGAMQSTVEGHYRTTL